MPALRARPRRAAALPLAVALLSGALLAAPAAADPLADASSSAVALRASVADLQSRTDTAVEDYDTAEDALAHTVAARLRADEAVDRARRAATATQDVRRARVRSLYEVGGPAALYGTVLHAASPVDALRGVHDAQRLLRLDSDSLRSDRETRDALARAARAASTAADAQVRETARVAGLVTTVQGLLDQQQALLQAADARVVRVSQQQQQEAQRRSEAAFASEVAAAGGSLPDLAPGARALAVLDAARAQVGKPYVWGATGPDSFDCSGLTRWAYAAAGVALPRTARQQWSVGVHPALADLQPGDLLFWATDKSDPATIHHVAIYAGAGLMVAAPHTGTDVQVQRVYAEGYLGATRVG